MVENVFANTQQLCKMGRPRNQVWAKWQAHWHSGQMQMLLMVTVYLILGGRILIFLLKLLFEHDWYPSSELDKIKILKYETIKHLIELSHSFTIKMWALSWNTSTILCWSLTLTKKLKYIVETSSKTANPFLFGFRRS